MLASTIILSLFASSTLAIPAVFKEARQLGLCSTASDTPLCCDVDVLGLADLDCAAPLTTPTNATDFKTICADEGKINMCCLLPVLDQALICTSP